MEHSVSAEGGGRNAAWGVAYGWGLDTPASRIDPVTLFKRCALLPRLTDDMTLPKLGTAFLYRLYVVEQ